MSWLAIQERLHAPLVLLAASAGIAAAPGADISLSNHASIGISAFYVSGADDDSWGENRVSVVAVAPGQTVHIAALRARGCKFDLRAIYTDGSVEDKRGVDACRTHQFVFDAATAIVPPALAQSHSVRRIQITNRASRAIVEIYVASSSVDDWGNDLIAHHPITPANSGEIKPDVSCLADLRIVFDNRSAEERRDLDLCAHAKLEIRPGWTTNEDGPQPATPVRAKPADP